MTRVYTVKSNARRDARKLGLNPELVKAVVGGFAIDYPDAKIDKLIAPKKPKAAPPARATSKATATSKPAAKPKAAKPAPAAREGDTKRDRLISMLADWTPLADLMKALDWQAHTVRGALSTAASTRGIAIERRRVDGITSYRVATTEAAAE